MAVESTNCTHETPMGATLIHDGATFRTWAPRARDVHVALGKDGSQDLASFAASAANRLLPMGDGTWGGFVPGVCDGDAYLFWIRGPVRGTKGFKRDPYARELACAPPFPDCPCLVRDARSYPWHDAGWQPPAFHELAIYQLHVGVFWSVDAEGRDRRTRYGRFL